MKRSAMKRTSGLARRTGLKTKTALSRGVSELKRTELRSRPRRVSAREKALRDTWGAAAAKQTVCASCGKRRGEWPLHGHHVLRRQVIERLAADAGLDVLAWAWRLAWMVPVCDDCHERHHNRSRRLEWRVVPVAAQRTAQLLDNALLAAGRPANAYRQLRREYGGEL